MYEEAFPPEERRLLLQQQRLLQEPHYQFKIILVDNSFVGLFCTWQFPLFSFLEHFAINPSCRGRGVGAAALRLWVEQAALPLVLEVELPETETAKRRVKFYQRAGFYLNEHNYLQPPYSPEKSWVPLQIMSYPQLLEKLDFERTVQIIYRQVYQLNSYKPN
ncbi:GNAT family N-acetyltransferase [Rufibacter roseus]|uniref:GNAT family N-acetyltransferase n=1 Tax=Rufibacter roseus TaxID=1567108 RepID=A0ABW2DQ62_9BACT|nr:GNAT family N-acetyltransferase [Rufibacter roseus]